MKLRSFFWIFSVGILLYGCDTGKKEETQQVSDTLQNKLADSSFEAISLLGDTLYAHDLQGAQFSSVRFCLPESGP